MGLFFIIVDWNYFDDDDEKLFFVNELDIGKEIVFSGEVNEVKENSFVDGVVEF